MRVEGETGSGAVVDPPDDIGAAVCKRANLSGEADGLEFGREEGGGLDLPRPGGFCVSIATSCSRRPVSRATSGASKSWTSNFVTPSRARVRALSQRDWSRPDNGSMPRIRQPRMTLRQPSEAFTTVISAVIVTSKTAPAIVPR